MSLRIAQAADIHLDASATVHGRILRNEHGENVRFEDRLRCFEAFVTGAIRERCDLAIIPGDLFERPRPTPLEYMAAERGLDRLTREMPVVLIADNHANPESGLEPHGILPLAGRHPDLHVVTQPTVIRPEVAGEIVQVACLPTPRRSLLLAREEMQGLGPEEVNAIISAKLRVILHGLQQQCDPTQMRILVAHVLVREASLGAIDTPSSAVWVAAQDLRGWHYVALGDVHRRQSFLEDCAWYSGALDRMDFGEESYRPGWLAVDVELRQSRPPTVTVHDTQAREYRTLAPAELTSEALLASCAAFDLESAPILRVTGEISEADYDALAPILARWRSLPTFADRLEVHREVRARVAEMGAELSAETALRLWAESEGRMEELPALLEAHREISP